MRGAAGLQGVCLIHCTSCTPLSLPSPLGTPEWGLSCWVDGWLAAKLATGDVIENHSQLMLDRIHCFVWLSTNSFLFLKIFNRESQRTVSIGCSMCLPEGETCPVDRRVIQLIDFRTAPVGCPCHHTVLPNREQLAFFATGREVQPKAWVSID